MVTKIYGLICPLTNEIKYIGKSNNPERRLKDHMWDTRGMDINKALWIKDLKTKKLKPILEILDEVPISTWQYWEEFWILYFKALGAKIFNKRAGNGLTYANHQTFKPGNIPWNKKLWDYKMI